MAFVAWMALVGCKDGASGTDANPKNTTVCADPGLRESEGPLVDADLGFSLENDLPGGFSNSFEYAPGFGLGDFDGDGGYDFLMGGHGPVLLMHQDGAWVDATETNLPKNYIAHQNVASVPVDYDADGDLDLFLANKGPDRLWRNDGNGVFEDVSKAAGIPVRDFVSQGAAIGDIDQNGTLDIFVSVRDTNNEDKVNGIPNSYPNHILLNNGDGTFTHHTETLLGDDVRGYTYMSSLLDLDGDGDVDLYMVNDLGQQVVGNRHLENLSSDGEVAWVSRTDDSGLGLEIHGMGLGVGDLNGDPVPDLLITDRAALNLMESAHGVWFDTSNNGGMVPDLEASQVVSWGAELVDLDNDGDKDAPILFGPSDGLLGVASEEDNPSNEPDALFLQQEDGTFVDVAEAWDFRRTTDGRALLAVDLNQDGWLDLIQRGNDYPGRVQLARCGDENWITVDLEGLAPNTQAVGARIAVETEERTFHHWVSLGSTTMMVGGPTQAHFGLGDVDFIDSITVVWPDQSETVLEGIDTKQHLRISQGE